MPVVKVPLRVSAASMAISGLLAAGTTPLHPNILTAPLGEAVKSTPMWTALHVAILLCIVLAFIGTAGVVAAHGNRLGRLGQAALAATLAGAVGGTAIMSVEAFAFPIMADGDPELLALDGPLFSSPLTVGLAILLFGWPLGLGMLGAAAAHARAFPRAAGLLLAISAPAFLFLSGFFVPVLGVLSGVALGAAQVWWGWLIWRSATEPRPAMT